MVSPNSPKSERIRLSADERKTAIALAALPVFAEKGFSGTTTKDLAKAAGVSEALLYRHFPSKEDLHTYIQDSICETNSAIHDFICSLEPGTRSLVMMISLLMEIVLGSLDNHPMGNSIPRIMIRSLLEDGEFTRSFHEPRYNKMLPFMEEAVQAAKEAGDMIDGPLSAYESQWFPHHLAVAIRLSELPPKPVFDYQTKRKDRIHHATWFSLRGIGLTDHAIEQYFHPERIEPILHDVLFRAGMRTHSSVDP